MKFINLILFSFKRSVRFTNKPFKLNYSFGGWRSGRSHPAEMRNSHIFSMLNRGKYGSLWYNTIYFEFTYRSCTSFRTTRCNEHYRVLFFVWWIHFPAQKCHCCENAWNIIIYLTFELTCGVSRETASIQCRRQIFLASSQSTSRLRVGWCSQLKKYEWATPRASR